jgi:hypothetical protein
VLELKAQEAEILKRIGARTQDELLVDEGILQLGSGKVACRVCTENRGTFTLTHATMRKPPWMSANGGLGLSSRITAKFREHKDSECHKACAEAAAAAAAGALPVALSKERARALAVVRRLLLVSCHIAIKKGSFRSYEPELLLLNECGVDVGETDHSRMTCREMLMGIADVGRGQLTTFLATKGTATSRKPHLGLSGDKVTDLAGKQFQIAMFRVNYRGTPLTLFAELTPLSCLAEAHDQDHEANGLSCFNEFVDVVEKFGVRLFRKGSARLKALMGIQGSRHRK